MDYLPIFLDIRGRKVIVDGGDTIAARRVERALSAGAEVLACDPNPCDEILGMSNQPSVTLNLRPAAQTDLAGCSVAYGCSEDLERDDQLFGWTRDTGILCNIADAPEHCDFITPSIVDRSPIVVAVSTGGTAPVIARILRARIEATLPASFGKLARFASKFRTRIANNIKDSRERRDFWERMIEGPTGDFFLAGDEARAHCQVLSDLEGHDDETASPLGEVYLVGAGPGDPDLLTFRALRLMQRTDVVLYDRLVDDEILSLVRRDAERVYVGKLPQHHTMSQDEISQLMVGLARKGNRVLRLKGGDPFIFGRGGEEIEALAENGIAFQVVPGITAATGCSTYAGIPLTHRDHAQSCTFVTAHGKNGGLDTEWGNLIGDGKTVAIYMGLSRMAALIDRFRAQNIDMATPAAVIENGTKTNQVVVTATLRDIEEHVQEAKLVGPTMIIIGSVVGLRNKLGCENSTQVTHAMSLSSVNAPGMLP